jgi:5-methylcytosine-specific restriction endonuclease McrA
MTPEQKREKNRAYYVANKAKWFRPEARARRRAYDIANPGRVKARMSRYRKRHAEKLKAARREWCARDGNWARTMRNWRAKNPKYYVGYYQIRGEAVERLYVAQIGLCRYCRTPVEKKFEVDHMLPISKGGSHDEANLCIACVHCNRSKGSKTAEQFMAVRS